MSPKAALLDLPLEVFTDVCQQLDLKDLLRVAETCKPFRHGDGGRLETVELPTKSPVVTALLAFLGGDVIPCTRPIGCSVSWVAYLVRRMRQRRCRDPPPFAVGHCHTLYVYASGRLLTCGMKIAGGQGRAAGICSDPTPVGALAGVRVRSVAAGSEHSLALGWDGRVYSFGRSDFGKLGPGDRLARWSPVLVDGIEGVSGIAAGHRHSLAVTRSGAVFSWGRVFPAADDTELRPIIVEGFGDGVRVRRVCAVFETAFAIADKGELFSWGSGSHGTLGHGDMQPQPSPKRVEAMRGIWVSSVSAGWWHALALTEDGLVYAWGVNKDEAVLGNPYVQRELLPRPIEALRGVRVVSIAATSNRSYVVLETGELWAWGFQDCYMFPPLGHGEPTNCSLPKPIESLRGIKVDAVAARGHHTLALADDGSVYALGGKDAAGAGALGLGPAVKEARAAVRTPQRLPVSLAATGL
jgi:alpha-tubulin suppressor-like RCC1 family protein